MVRHSIHRVMAGLVPAIPIPLARDCHVHRDARHIGERSDAVLRTAKAGHDALKSSVSLAGLLASSSLAALLIGGGVPAFAACTAVTGGYTNPGGATVACITVQNTSFTGNLSNAGTIKPGNGPANGTGIAITTHSTITGQISNAGVISVGGAAITIDSTSEITGGIGNAGAISSGENAIAVNGSIFTGGISNSGRITANSTGILISVSTFAGGISNAGTISAGGPGIQIFASIFSGGISNSGTISAGLTVISAHSSTFTGGITNSGTISAGGKGISFSSVAQFGTSSAGGGISNSGTISAHGSGISVNGVTQFSGGIANSGTISAGGAGIVVESYSTFSGGISNSGTISAAGDSIVIDDVSTFVGGISNSGTIVTGGVGIEAVFVTQFGTSSASSGGGITNSGTISVTNASGGIGIIVEGVTTFTGGISNAGTISGGNVGIDVEGGTRASVTFVSIFTGGISNSGTINTGQYGLRVSSVAQFGSSSAGGGIVNSGAISVTASTGAGISVGGVTTFTGGISNSGTISAGGTGVRVTFVSTFTGGISNSGTISAAGFHYGINVGATPSHTQNLTLFTGGITNSGAISATGGFTAVSVNYVGTFTGGISNSGRISAASGAAGITVVNDSTFTGGISNSGTISGANTGITVVGTATFTGGISNSGTISAGTGINVNNVTQFGSSSAGGGITNSGTILDGFNGISIDNVTTFYGGISNSGTISGGGGISASNFSTFYGGISNSGTIVSANSGLEVGSGSIFSGGLSNSGTIVAAHTGIGVFSVTTFLGGISNSGTISGSVGILVANSGPVSIFDSGTIVGTGGTAVDLSGNATGNTFTLGPGYSITGLVKGQGADTFQLGGTGSGNFNLSSIGAAQQYRGFTAFNVVSGTWNTTGTFGQAQGWNVYGGTLAGTGTFNIGALNAINVNNGGTLAPGTPGVAGTVMTINGNLAFASGATYLVTLNGTSASRANVTGNVTLNGALDIVLLPGSYNSKTAYDILDPASISGRFTSVSVVGAPGLSGGLSFGSTDAFLNLTANIGGSGGLSANQQGVANTINTVFNNGGTLPAGFFPAFSQSGSSLGNTLAQLSGEPATDAGKGANQLMTDFMALMLDPTAGGGGNISGGGASGFAPEQDTSLPADVARAYADALKAPQAQESQNGSQNSAPQSFDQRWSTWGSAFGGASFIDGNAAAGTNNVTASDYGFAAGMERHLTPDTVYGFGLAGGGTNWNLAQNLGSGRSDSFQAGLYAKTHWGPLYLSGALAFADHWFTTDRIALGDQLRATFTGQSYAARGEVGYRYAVPVTGVQNNGAIVGVTPYAALQAQDFHTPSYSETDLTGGGLGLSYASANATDTRSELGARFDNLQVINGMPLILRGRLAWAHDWYTDATALNAIFQALPGSAFTVNGAAPPKNSALTTAAAELHITQSWTAIAKFDGDFGAGAQTYGGTGTLKYSW